MEEKLEELKKQLAECKKQSEEYLAGWQRAKADYANLEKRQTKLLEEFKEFADAATLLELLDIVDSFEQAEKALPEELRNHEWAKGVMRIKSAWDEFLKRK
ncbi:nucleotide exchange factor GrpE, partial [Candidatus Azambacteria bacterium]|nr:nucleotide exchange factor GrpE [Candidatus Azambacteria bacterium]